MSFDLDASLLDVDASTNGMTSAVLNALIEPACSYGKRSIASVRVSNLPDEEKAKVMALHMKSIMLGVMAQANLRVIPLLDDAFIDERLPAERERTL